MSDGSSLLPPGQRESSAFHRFGLLPMAARFPREQGRATLDVAGAVETPLHLSDPLRDLPRTDLVCDFHCVTTWSRMDNRWGGVRFADLAQAVGVRDSARFVLTEAYDRYPGTEIPYTTNLPLAEALLDDVMLVHTWEGRPLPVEHGGPLRMITPQLYAWKGAKWINRIQVTTRNVRGFWEERGYSDTAFPWQDDRYG